MQRRSASAAAAVLLLVVRTAAAQTPAKDPDRAACYGRDREAIDACTRLMERCRLGQSLDELKARGCSFTADRNFELKNHAAWVAGYAAARAEARLAMIDLGEAPTRSAEAAVADAEQSLALNPKQERALRLRGRARITLGEYEAAIADLTTALAVEEVALDDDHPYRRDTYSMRGDAFSSLCRHSEAIADFTRVIEWPRKWPNEATRRERHLRSLALISLGQFHLAADDIAAMEAAQAPAEYTSFARLVLQRRSGHLDEAMSLADGLATKQPAWEIWLWQRGLLYIERENLIAAWADLEKAVALDPTSREMQLDRALLAKAMGKRDEARAAFEKLLSANNVCTEKGMTHTVARGGLK